MPIYEYHCKKCNKNFEELQGFNDKPLKKCRECGGKLERLISLSAFHLKGSGWYETDYGKKKNPVKSPNTDNNNNGTANKTDEKSSDSGEQTVESIKKETDSAKQKSS